MAEKARRVGVLTGGGDCPGLNAVIRGVVHRLLRHHKVEVFGSEDAFNGFLDEPARVYPLALGSVSGILGKGGTILGTTNRGNPFAFPTKVPGGTELLDVTDRLKAAVEGFGLDGLICIGGDGTLGIAHRLMAECGINVIGVPKTIDNDVASTDYTFGFWTAVQRATDAIDTLHSTAESHDRVMVVELMGRDAGFITLAAGLAGGADVILIPEIPYDLTVLKSKIQRRRLYGRSFSIVAVAEGAHAKGEGQKTETLTDDRQKGRERKLGGIGRWVAGQLEEVTGIETRVTVLGHLQRGGSPVAFDRVLATSFGVAAADAAAEGDWGKMVTLQTPHVVRVPLAEAVGQKRIVDLASTWIEAARGVGICLGD